MRRLVWDELPLSNFEEVKPWVAESEQLHAEIARLKAQLDTTDERGEQNVEALVETAETRLLAMKAHEKTINGLKAKLDYWRERAEKAEVQLAEAWTILEHIIYASDRCYGHRGCGHGMEPWQEARAFLSADKDKVKG